VAAARWVTFDCFGTLVDWNRGFETIVKPLANERSGEVIAAYHRFERVLEAERPHRLYKDVLTAALLAAAATVELPITEAMARSLPASWGSMPVFDDVEPMLEGLRTAGYRLAVLTNCDEDLFARTQRSFRRPFDLVVTAERVGSYKPAPGHFLHFAHQTGVGRSDWVHVANSWFHDIAPACELGITSVWLDRDRTGEDRASASAYVQSAGDVLAAIAAISA
jgi:2-haloacid dehalogenase